MRARRRTRRALCQAATTGRWRLWSVREEAPVAAIDAKANVCSVQLSPLSSHLLAFGSANYRVYLYDLRHMKVGQNCSTCPIGSIKFLAPMHASAWYVTVAFAMLNLNPPICTASVAFRCCRVGWRI